MGRRTTADWRAVVFQHPNVSAPCKLTLLYLAEHMKANGEVSLPQERIAATLSMAVRSVGYHVREARENGLLDLVAAGRKGRTAVYKRVFPSAHSLQDIAGNPPAGYEPITDVRLQAKDLTDPRDRADLSQIACNTLQASTTEPGTSSHLDGSNSDMPEGPSSPKATTSPGERATPPAADDDEDQSSNPNAAAAPSADQGEGSEDWQQFNSLTTEEKLRFRKYAGAKSLGLYARTLDRDGDLGLKLAEWRAEEESAATLQAKHNPWDGLPTISSTDWEPGYQAWTLADQLGIDEHIQEGLLDLFRRKHPEGTEVDLNRMFCEDLEEAHRTRHSNYCAYCGNAVQEPHTTDCANRDGKAGSRRPKYCPGCRTDYWNEPHAADCALDTATTQGAA